MTKLSRWLALATVPVALTLTLLLGTGVAQQSAPNARSGQLHITKYCSPTGDSGAAGSYCTITSSNLPEIKVGSSVFYTEANVNPATPEGGPIGLDSTVVLYVGVLNWAVGRCTLDNLASASDFGLCTFSDGVGPLAGFTARVNVSWLGPNIDKGNEYAWNGTYSFTPLPPQ
jgi:hypothetical protein